MAKVGFIGGGNMAEALIKGILSAGVYSKEDIIVSDISEDRRKYLSTQYELEVTDDNTKPAGSSDILIFSVKPQNIDDVLADIKTSLKKGGVIVSIAAGVRTDKIKAALGNIAIIRVMPNTPALVGEGASGIFANEKGMRALREDLGGSLTALQWALPDLSRLDIRAGLLYGQWPPASDLLAGATMALGYTALLLGLAIWRFNTREFS